MRYLTPRITCLISPLKQTLGCSVSKMEQDPVNHVGKFVWALFIIHSKTNSLLIIVTELVVLSFLPHSLVYTVHVILSDRFAVQPNFWDC